MSRALFILILVISVLGEFSTGAYIPMTPLTGQMLLLDPDVLQFSIASFILAFAFAQLFLGPLSDSIGRRPVVIGGLIIFLAGSIWGILVDTGAGLSLARAIQGIGAAAGYVVSRAILRDVSEGPVLATRMGLVMLAYAGAILISPSVGSLVAWSENWRLLFMGSIALGGALLIWSGAALEETNPATVERPAFNALSILSGYANVFRNPPYVGVVVVHSFGYGCLYIFLSAFPLISVDTFGVQPVTVGTLITLAMSGLVAGLLTARKLVPRLGMQKCISLGVGLICTGVVIFLALAAMDQLSLASLLISQLVLMFGGGLVAPNTTALSMTLVPDRAGMAAAGLGFLSMTIAAVGVWLTGLIYDGSILPVALLQLGFASVAALACLATIQRISLTPPT